MTIVYCDYTTGNDSTGTGSYTLPYKTTTKASTGLTGGDEVRVAMSAAPTALSGTLSWVDGSASVATSADQTGVLAAKSFIRPTGDVIPWEVLSLTSTTITLKAAYCGTSKTVSSEKLNPTDTGAASLITTQVQVVSASGTSAAPLVISGGWNLTTRTQTGETWLLQSGTNNYGYGLYISGKTYVTISDLGFLRYAYGVLQDSLSSGNRINLYGIGCSTGLKLYSMDSEETFSGLYTAGCGSGIYLASEIAISCTMENVQAFSCTAGGVAVDNALYAKFVNPIVKRCGYGFYLWSSSSVKFASPVIENCTTGITNDYGTDVVIYNGTFASNSTDISVAGITGVDIPVTFSQRHNGVAGDNRAYGLYGMSQSNSADARTGTCLKVTPISATEHFQQRIGLCQVTATSANITLGVYIKDDSSFNGTIQAAIYHMGEKITGWTSWTPTTTYTLNTITASSADLVAGEMLELWTRITGTAGSVYIDDVTLDAAVLSSGVPATGKMLQADGSGNAIEATNTNAEVSGAVTLSHTQGTDQGLDAGGFNAVTAAELKAAITAFSGGSVTGDVLRYNSATSAWESNSEPLSFTEIILTPSESAALDAEGGVWYKSTEKSVYICTDDE